MTSDASKYTVWCMKNRLKKILFLIKNFRRTIGLLDDSNLKFNPFVPVGKQNNFQKLDSMLMESKFFFDSFQEILIKANNYHDFEKLKISNKISRLELEKKLEAQMDFHGSDKGSRHGYTKAYSQLLNHMPSNRKMRLLEIGIGTNNVALSSNMGRNGRPGASLLAWQGTFEHAQIHAADIDLGIVGSIKDFKCFYLDQTVKQSWEKLISEVNVKYDVIVDDGLHSILSNINTLIYGRRILSNQGVIIIEDIPDYNVDFWKCIKPILEIEWTLKIFRGNFLNLIIAQLK
jgi:hypothetical protein